MLLELIEAAKRTGIAVREVALEAPASKGGLVILKGKPMLFIDLALSIDERLKIIAGALKNMDMDDIYLSPAARSLVENSGPV